MPSTPPRSTPPRGLLRILLPQALLIITLLVASATPALQAQTAPVVQPTVAPPPPTQPPPPPPTQPPPPPTQPPPTAVPPTAVPPTDVPPTEIPATEVPSPTAEPTSTAAPPPPPTSPPRNQPVAPVQPTQPVPTATPDITEVTCRPAPRSTPLSPGLDDWALYACTLPLDLGPLASLTLVGTPTSPGWQVILVEEDAPDTPGLLNASNNRLELGDLAGRREAEFLLGARLGCTALPATTVSFAITGTRPESDQQVRAQATLDLAATIHTPALAVTGFADHTLTVTYSDALASCGWQLLVTLDGVTDTPTVTGVELATGATTGSDLTSRAAPIPGAISILVPAGPEAGTITISTNAEPSALIVEAFPAP